MPTSTYFLHSSWYFFPHVLSLLVLNSPGFPSPRPPTQTLPSASHPKLWFQVGGSPMPSCPRPSPQQLIPEAPQPAPHVLGPHPKAPEPLGGGRGSPPCSPPLKVRSTPLPRAPRPRDLYLHPAVTPIPQAPCKHPCPRRGLRSAQGSQRQPFKLSAASKNLFGVILRRDSFFRDFMVSASPTAWSYPAGTLDMVAEQQVPATPRPRDP